MRYISRLFTYLLTTCALIDAVGLLSVRLRLVVISQKLSKTDSVAASDPLLDAAPGWLCGAVVERRSLTGELSLHCTRPS